MDLKLSGPPRDDDAEAAKAQELSAAGIAALPSLEGPPFYIDARAVLAIFPEQAAKQIGPNQFSMQPTGILGRCTLFVEGLAPTVNVALSPTQAAQRIATARLDARQDAADAKVSPLIDFAERLEVIMQNIGRRAPVDTDNDEWGELPTEADAPTTPTPTPNPTDNGRPA